LILFFNHYTSNFNGNKEVFVLNIVYLIVSLRIIGK